MGVVSVERANHSLTVTLREEGQVELLGETPKQLGASLMLPPRQDDVKTFLLRKNA